MTDAFKCDMCGEYRDGTPAKTYYEQCYDRMQNTEYRKALEVCSDCQENIERRSLTMNGGDP